uniref:Uncharacterized protein n=1 Tax=viral metagenome TaxID=1070528 RepID=A0A2V0RB98_9ZZZZ
MTIVNDTKDYAIKVASTALNSFESQARGDIQAPNGDDNVRMYTAKGGSAVTLGSSTTSATVVFDPEASIRQGQASVVVYGRNSSNAVIEVQRVTLGRSSDEFLSVGVLSSGLKVFNSSGVDVIGGTQSAAVLTSVPRNVSILSSTDLANACPNHERDLASGVVSREESTMTMAMTEHFGKKMALSRSNTLGNIIKRTWDDGIGTRRTTAGETLSFLVDTNLTATTTDLTDVQILGTPGDPTSTGTATAQVLDSARLSELNNPLTLATYHAEIEMYLDLGDPGSSALENTKFEFKLYALDAADNIISVRRINRREDLRNAKSSGVTVTGSVTSTTVPISRVVVGLVVVGGANVNDPLTVVNTSARLTAYEETADIAARPIHVCVFEGLNASATINLNSTVVLTGVPDSTNVFISTAQSGDVPVYDTNAVEVFLKSVSRSLPRAFTVSGHSAVSRSLDAFYGDEAVSVAFKAMSFSDVQKGVQHVAKLAKKSGSELSDALRKLEPFMRSVGTPMSALPGPAGALGGMMVAGADYGRMMR